MSIADHAADAPAIVDHLEVPRAHIAGHSSGAAVAAQLALDHPDTVHTLILLELSLFSVPSGEAFFQQAGPAFEAYGSGDHEGALAIFMGAVSGLDRATCRAVLEERVPGSVAQAIKDADTFFGIELPALTEWAFGPEQAAAINQPVLSVLGTLTSPVDGSRRLPARFIPARRGLHDRWRRPPPAHPASRARRTSDRRVPGEQLHGRPLTMGPRCGPSGGDRVSSPESSSEAQEGIGIGGARQPVKGRRVHRERHSVRRRHGVTV